MSKDKLIGQGAITSSDVERMLAESRARREKPWDPRKVAAAAAVGTALVATTVGLAFGMRGNNTVPSGQPEGNGDNTPAATLDYLKSRPTKTVTIEAGEGVDDAVYAVDPQTVGASADLKEGITKIVEGQVGKTESGVAMPQAGEQVEVPNLPESIKQVPPAAR